MSKYSDIYEILIKYDNQKYYIEDYDYPKICIELITLFERKSFSQRIINIFSFIAKMLIFLIFFAIIIYIVIGIYFMAS